MNIVRRRATSGVERGQVVAADDDLQDPGVVTLPGPRSEEGEAGDGAVDAVTASLSILGGPADDGPAANGTVLLVGSSGGHLAQLLALAGLWTNDRVLWVTFPTADAVSRLVGRRVVHCHHPTTRNVPNLLRNGVLAWRVLRRERPVAIVSTGAGVAVPFFAIGRLLGIPTVFIEVYDRIDSATLTGRLCRPFASRVLVQWEEQRRLYPRSVVIGPLL